MKKFTQAQRVPFEPNTHSAPLGKVLTIYFDKDKKSCQRVKLHPGASRDYQSLVEALTCSQIPLHKNYHSWDIV